MRKPGLYIDGSAEHDGVLGRLHPAPPNLSPNGAAGSRSCNPAPRRERKNMVDPFTIDKSAQRWLFKTAHKHYWRVQSWYELDDLIQDGYMTWCMVVSRYADSVRERCKDLPEHKRTDAMIEVMMSLFTRSYINHIHDLATKRTRIAETVIADLVSDGQTYDRYLDKILADEATTSEEAELVNCAPDGVREVLQLYTNEPDSPKINAKFRIRRDGSRESLNERLCRLAGVDGSVDLVSSVKAYLRGDEKDPAESLVDKLVFLLMECPPGSDDFVAAG